MILLIIVVYVLLIILLPFQLLDDNEYLQHVKLVEHSIAARVADADIKCFCLNPFECDKDICDNDVDIDADANHYNYLMCQCIGYASTDRLVRSMSGDNLSLMHLNAGGLVSKVDLLYANMQQLKHKFSVIAITETWSTPSTEGCIDLPGYHKIIRSRSDGRKGGGVALYFDSDLDLVIKNRPDLESVDPTLYESLIVQVSQPGNPFAKDIIIGAIYKPPQTQTDSF